MALEHAALKMVYSSWGGGGAKVMAAAGHPSSLALALSGNICSVCP